MSDKKNKKVVKSSIKDTAFNGSDKSYPYSIWLVLALVFVVFLPALTNSFVNWDDPKYILNNVIIKDLSGKGIKAMFTSFYAGNYHPLTALSNAIEFKLFGLNPKPFHFFNLVLHLANTLLVFSIIRKLCKDIRIALVVSLLFGIHPMHVESVAWIAERKDVLYTFFYLIAITKYIRFRESKDTKQYVFMVIAFLCSLLSKSAAVVFPVTLLVLDYYSTKTITKAAIINKLPLFCLSIIFGFVALKSQKAEGALSDLTIVYSYADRIFLVLHSIVFYLAKLVLPVGLSAFHSYPDKVNELLPWYYYLSPVILGLVFFAIYKLKKYRNELIFGFLFFVVNIILVIQIIPVGQAFVAERYSYVPYIGLFFIVATLFFYALDNFKSNKMTIQVTGVICILILSGTTFSRTKVWKDGVTLWTDVINKYPAVYFAYYNLGNAHKDNKDYPKAIEAYSGALKVNADYSSALFNRAHAYADMQNHQAAVDDYTKVIKLTPKGFEANYNRGVSNATLKNYDAAIADFTASIEIEPKRADTYYSRGNMKASKMLFEEAMSDYSMAIKMDPKYADAYNNRGNCKLNLRRVNEACEDWKVSVSLGGRLSSDMIKQYCK
ncbi:MAG: tetratricopeptide repeat protein [Bacteroidota bacterium]